jgi:hypothetical protein
MGELINYYIIESGLIKERTNSLITSLGFSIVIFEICSSSLISFFVGSSLIVNDIGL